MPPGSEARRPSSCSLPARPVLLCQAKAVSHELKTLRSSLWTVWSQTAASAEETGDPSTTFADSFVERQLLPEGWQGSPTFASTVATVSPGKLRWHQRQ